MKEKGKNVADFDNEIKRGGALFAGRGNPSPPNGVNGVSMIDPTAPVASYATRYDSYDTVKLRADARSMLAQRNLTQSFANIELKAMTPERRMWSTRISREQLRVCHPVTLVLLTPSPTKRRERR